MCRNIRTLFNFDPPATDEEIRAASVQFVRKLSGFTKPSQANHAAFDAAVEEVLGVARRLIDSLVTNAPARDRQEWAARAKARAAQIDDFLPWLAATGKFFSRSARSLRTRILMWSEEEIRLGNLPPKSGSVLEAMLYRGEVPRGDAAKIVGTGDRQARRVVSVLIAKGVLTSESPRAPLRLAFLSEFEPRPSRRQDI